METAVRQARNGRALLLACVLFVVTIFVSMAMEEMPELSQSIRVPVVLIPVVVFAYFLFAQRRVIIDKADELEQRVQLEALSFAFPVTFLFLVLLGQLERVIHLNPEDWDYSHIWPFVFMFYLLGLTLAKRRYQ